MKKWIVSNIGVCPTCKKELEKPKNLSVDIRNLTAKRKTTTRKLLQKMAMAVIKDVPLENQNRYYYFLKAIENIQDEVIIRSIEGYMRSKAIYEGKGFAYLRAIICRAGEIDPVREKNEKKIYGTSPPIYKRKQ